MFNTLDTRKTDDLFMVRKGWFSHEYELTDKIYNYGKITYHRLSVCKATAITATDTWIFKREGIFSRTLLITGEDMAIIGRATQELFSRKVVLTLQTGFSAEFNRPSIWSRVGIWRSTGYGEIMHIKSNPLCLTDFIHIYPNKAPTNLIPLLIFFGSFLTVLRRRRQAAH